MLRDIYTVVVSHGGWSWTFAWAQLGVIQINCVPLTLRARMNLAELRETLSGKFVIVVGQPEHLPDMINWSNLVICGHVSMELGSEMEGLFTTLKPGIPLMISSHPESSEQVQARLPGLTCTEVLCH